MNVQEIPLVKIERCATEIILDLGVPAHLKGYHFLREAIVLSVYDMERVTSVTKLLYPMVGKKFFTNGSRVERAIRNAIEVSWERGSAVKFESLFVYSKEMGCKRPTNSEYIARIADQIRLDLQD